MNDTLWQSLDRAVEWVKYAESKALAILAVHSVTLGFFLTLCSDKADSIKTHPLTQGAVFVALTTNLISLFFCFRCLNPRLKLSGGKSPIYFGSIALSFNNSAEFEKFFRESLNTDEKIGREVAGQVFVNCQIAWRKFKDVGWAMRFMTFSVLFWIGAASTLVFI